jgi:allantoin racemase
LIARRDADVLVLGCMSLSFLGIAEPARERLGIPIVNPAMCALKTAESLVAQRLRPSRRTYAAPGKDVLAVEEMK